MSKLLRRAFSLCSALLMSFSFGPSTRAAIVYEADNFFWKLYSENRSDMFSLINNIEALRKKTNTMLDKLLEDGISGEENWELEREKAVKCAMCSENITPDEYAYSCEGCLRNGKPDLYHVDCIFRYVMKRVLSSEKNEREYSFCMMRNPLCQECGEVVGCYTPKIIIPDKKLSSVRK